MRYKTLNYSIIKNDVNDTCLKVLKEKLFLSIKNSKILIIVDDYNHQNLENISKKTVLNSRQILLRVVEESDLEKVLSDIDNGAMRNIKIFVTLNDDVEFIRMTEKHKYHKTTEMLKSKYFESYVYLYYYSENYSETELLYVSKLLKP
ncbi:hypothetical protein [Acholeplasma laidlawii]|uniref:Uncharacterized protein n=2 Tax=Acholeplasma laidlawii TaxID=2148 RepID=A9NGR2_ACHLI|nr:hypothetical protein [Acholeplasma laidlawii]ABX81542.1 hypothetical protein ACL_0929 [Acholeplasma laidlawii PG-8A]NWH09886.1 hypothetical protein [Acholeplasma laidlawii]NWH11276.1 hypothetical protein [Acholeplasma laidlawii]NWH13314.1 hypothetical protein [Acholeplasma laidlawii]NWH14138.1 hypothetical protein [Acholeplasma laidlawii]